MLLIMASDVSHLGLFESDMKSDNMLLIKMTCPGSSGASLLWGMLVVSSNSTTNRLHFNQRTEHIQSPDMVVITCNEEKVIISPCKCKIEKKHIFSCWLLLWLLFLKSNIIPAWHPHPQQSLVHSRLAATSRWPHMSEIIPHGTGETLIVFLYEDFFYCSQNDRVIIPLWNHKSCVTCLICCLSCRVLHASISSRNTEVHLLPNKSQSTAFLLYTSRHLACNLPVCRGDLRPPNDPNRRHACNCSGWRNDSLFQYLFIHTLWNERDFEDNYALHWTLQVV